MSSRTSPLAALFLLVGFAACSSPPSVVRDDSAGDTGGFGGGDPVAPTGGRTIEVGGDSTDGTGGGAELPDPVCGNGELEPGELCDDGNDEGGDGCSADCARQNADYACVTPGEPCVRAVTCGNGIIEGDEACDDGGEAPGDGCASDCSAIDDGFACPRPGRACVELAVCGNGVLERGESCDDANEGSSDGCSGTDEESERPCQLEPGFFCPAPGDECVPLDCGDGTRTPDEACDDGGDDPGDGCSVACTVEPGWRCSADGCSPICGDDLVVGVESCDDGERTSGDGCSAACVEEPYYDCVGEPSACDSSIECGNGEREPGEICDPPGSDGCGAECDSFVPEPPPAPVCGNTRVEAGEECDPPRIGTGCDADCAIAPGFACPRPGVCFALPECGDGVVNAGEECDVGGTPSPGCVGCSVQSGWFCYGGQPSICELPVCGDGVRAATEECDDDDEDPLDGCDADCELEDGWVCPEVGEDCIPDCGDGVVVGGEECDDGNRANDDGCNVACRVEPGFVCPDEGEDCVPAECGNGDVEPGEGCDDDNAIAGDGCGPTCQVEPNVDVGPNPTVDVFCGDGMITGAEACDDGNVDADDGCAPDCTVEDGYVCEPVLERPSFVEFAVTYRDFKRRSSNPGGHPDFESGYDGLVREMPGPVCTVSDDDPCEALPGELCPDGTCSVLDDDGKPVHHMSVDDAADARVLSPETFALWYRDDNDGAVVGDHGAIEMCAVEDSLRLDQIGGPTSDTYEFDSSSFFPVAARCFGPQNGSNNFHFTTELRYFFQYQGGETLTFRGDDDVWVYINGRLAVDIGGVHSAEWGRVVLGDDGDGGGGDSTCSRHGGGTPPACSLAAGEVASDDDKRFGLTKGGVYEIVLFHAERHTTQSNFRLTLAGFLAPRSYCTPDCGDGELVGWEVCDDGDDNSDSVYGSCNETCSGRSFCGDGVRQGPTDDPSGPEACDDGRNLTLRETGAAGECGPGCTAPSSCGDGVVQAAYEACDNGPLNSDDAHGLTSCTTECELGGYCGDGIENGPELCDDGVNNGQTYGPTSCGLDCLPGPRCGDGIRNGAEECDGSLGCTAECVLGPYCGDGLVDADAGEECDYGQFASDLYGGCTDECQWGPSCGDGNLDAPFEECDAGDAGNVGDYDGCTSICTLGPRCGDGVLQDDEGEECDNGFNDDAYSYNASSCGPGCELPSACGDGVVDAPFELCDQGEENDDLAYNGCTSTCAWGPFCGDGIEDAEESCDDGLENTLYSSTGAACGPDCEPAPFCGDGVRNGSEECDEGTDGNVGGYGGCKPDCSRGPFCGDGVVQASRGEQCDDGPIGSLDCTPTCQERVRLR